MQAIGYQRPCLECLGQYRTENAALEMDGKLDDPAYIKGLDDTAFLDAHENVFVFSSHLASLEILQLLSLFISPSGIADLGQQMYHFVVGDMEVDHKKKCLPNCFFQGIVGKGDYAGVTVWGLHTIAEQQRLKRSRDEKNLLKQKRAGKLAHLLSPIVWFQKLIRRRFHRSTC